MLELIFPLSALLITFFGIIPLLTLLSARLLARRRRAGRWIDFGSDSTFTLLVAPTLLPLGWLVSAALHQSEPSRALRACLIDHEATSCLDAIVLLGLLGSILGLLLLRHGWRERSAETGTALALSEPLAARIRRLVEADARLAGLRVVVVRRGPAPVFLHGLLRPRIALDACFARDSDDAILRAALLHERAHLRARDTMRLLLAGICRELNPLGHLLVADFERWRRAREARCDSEAIHMGGEPLALAEGILRAARFRCSEWISPDLLGLVGHDALTLRLRVALLTRSARGSQIERAASGTEPGRPRLGAQLLLGLALLGLIVLPHLGGPGVLEHFHFAVEDLL
ncbi:MAG: hypothetical protein OEY14_01140 [Myxococcales bacterium]|nr:hypothetical protein [Myxococcales bacterium]